MTRSSWQQNRADGHQARSARHTRSPGIALALIVSCEFMLQLDTTITNVALPAIQEDLGFGQAGLSWVINAFLLTFGGLLLLGGRAGDILGHRGVFLAGTALFTLASALGGLAPSADTLVVARALQGTGAALAAPTGIALLATNFPEGPERNRAFAVFSTVAGSGLALGLVLGGLLTSGLSWRWVLFLNIPFGVLVLALTPRFLTATGRTPGRFDLAGALTSTVGMTALVYAFIRVSERSWGDTVASVCFPLGAVLLGAFLAIEKRAAQPVMPLRLFRRRSRAGAYVNLLLIAATLTSVWFFLVQFLQRVLGYDALRAGLAFLPMAVAVFVSSQLVPRILPKCGTTPVALTGMALVGLATGWLTRLTTSTGYLSGVLGPLLLFGLGAGLVLVSHNLAIMSATPPGDTGATSSVLQAMLTVGGSLGLALLVAVFGRSRREAGENGAERSRYALTEGITAAFTLGCVFAVIGLLVAGFVVRSRRAPAVGAPRPLRGPDTPGR
ncbi:MFS transporter [Streptomyces sp. PU-14G]|uniref:MFS transporter n=1 Tax=Streptomyces sp. PU-14G TaxID=2800808 RepID=UPI0034DFC72A